MAHVIGKNNNVEMGTLKKNEESLFFNNVEMGAVLVSTYKCAKFSSFYFVRNQQTFVSESYGLLVYIQVDTDSCFACASVKVEGL